jgi:CHAT domain
MILKEEAAKYKGKQSLMPYEEFFSDEWVVDGSEFVAYRLCFFRIFYANNLGEVGDRHKGNEQLSMAKAVVSQQTQQGLETFNPRLHLLYMMVDASLNPEPDLIERLDRRRELAYLAGQIGDYTIQNAILHEAVGITHEIRDTESSILARIVAVELEKKTILEMLKFAFEHGQLPMEVGLALSSFWVVSKNPGFAREWLLYYEQFQELWLHFDVPLVNERLLYIAATAVRHLGDQASMAKFLRQHKKAVENCPGIKRAVDGSLEVVNDQGESKLRAHETWLMDIHEAQLLSIMRNLIRWVHRDLNSGILSYEEATTILAASHILVDVSADSTCAKKLQLDIFGTGEPIDSSKWSEWYGAVEGWLRRHDVQRSFRPPLEQQEMLAKIKDHRILSLSSYRTREGLILDYGSETWTKPSRALVWSDRIKKERENFLDFLETIDLQAFDENNRMTLRSHIITDEHLIWRSLNAEEKKRLEFNDGTLVGLQTRYEEVGTFRRQGGNLSLLFLHLQTLAFIRYDRWRLFRSIPFSEIMEPLEEKHEIFHNTAGQGFITRGFEVHMSAIGVADEMDVSELYHYSLRFCMEAWTRWRSDNLQFIAENPTAEAPIELEYIAQSLVKWTQRSKARALALAMGIDLAAPRLLWGIQNVSTECMELMDEYSSLSKQFGQELSFAENITIFEKLQSIWTQMESDDTASTILGMLRGRSANSIDLRNMCFMFDEPVILVDWFHLQELDGPGDLAMVVYRDGKVAGILQTDLKLVDVEKWIADNLDPEIDDEESEVLSFIPLKDDDATDSLRSMNKLVSGLAKLTAPGELLVFCPTLALNRVPLHALEVDDTPCIVRNPVVYCQSLTLLRMCIWERLALCEDENLAERMPAVFYPLRAGSEVDNAVKDVASELQVPVLDLINSESPKQSFLDGAANASIIHFHGHVYFDGDRPLEHCLELKQQRRDDNGPIPLENDEKITAQELFQSRLQRGTHVTTISCKSARANITKANDHVGLVASLHGAGASSMVSSLWDIHRAVGVRYSKLFYDHLKQQEPRYYKQMSDGEPWAMFHYVDLARAHQHAIIHLRMLPDGEVQAPDKWASLVFHGSWALPRVWIDRNHHVEDGQPM